MVTDFEIHVQPKWGCDLMEIFFISRLDGKASVGEVGKDGQLTFHEIKEGAKMRGPTLALPSFYWKDFVKAVSEDLPNVTQDEIDAELKATKYHLEDMRELVFKK